ncbi:glycosyl hydrolase family 71-domain-containing protein [Cadophora sp. MPI-SDFR-AT-0126]|nr:glycosyl hydrolase family 71-domain-containing protein [Leotiomycetes sp. MPI-SDFR-AT-0126]
MDVELKNSKVSNSGKYTTADWENDIKAAQAAHIDAFAMNFALNEATTDIALPAAFAAADRLDFALFFSFDYAANGTFPKETVIKYINDYAGRPSYYRYKGKPFVSTFEGPDAAVDWKIIKASTDCHFVPDWSSKGAKDALIIGAGVVDGLFSWAGWPWGPRDMDTYVDASYGEFLDNVFGGDGSDFSHYMMPVSPWFFTNMPGFDKNWMWRGDSLWYDRWEQVKYLQPEFVQIITWNDWGESHYIGPLHVNEMDVFGEKAGNSPYNYVSGMPHDGWRQFLPYVIDTYKNNISTVTQEGITAWFRPNPVAGSPCSSGGTSGNTHTQFQVEFPPGEIAQDKVFYSALLGSATGVTVTVSIGGQQTVGTWAKKPWDGVGIYHGNVFMAGATGAVIVTLKTPQGTYTNWNAWVGGAAGNAISATPTLKTNDQVCIAGTGANDFKGLCEFACYYGYCPVGACYCTQMGKPVPRPSSRNVLAYPVAGKSASYEGLCAFVCNYGYCPSDICGYTKQPLTTPTISPFLPEACTGGSGSGDLAGLCGFGCGYGALGALPAYKGDQGIPMEGKSKAVYGDLCKFAYAWGYYPLPSPPCQSTVPAVQACVEGVGEGNLGGLCSYSCGYGVCPPLACKCLVMGPQVAAPPKISGPGYALPGLDTDLYGELCDFTCSRGYCPPGACTQTKATVVYVDPIVWSPTFSDPVFGPVPAILVLPPSTLPSPTTVKFPPFITSLEVGWVSNGKFTGMTTTTTLSIPDVTVSVISFWNVIVSESRPGSVLYPTTSISPPPFTITNVYPAGVTAPPVTRTIHPPPYPWSAGSAPSPGQTDGYLGYFSINGERITVIPQTYTTTISGGKTVTVGQSMSTDFWFIYNGRTYPIPTSTQTKDSDSDLTIGAVLPFIPTFPTAQVSPVKTKVPVPTATVIDGKKWPVLPCRAWFFFICISNQVEGLVLFGFEFPGIYPRGGPPPGIDFPVIDNIDFPEIEWPPVTIGWDLVPTYASMPESEPCETTSMTGCTTYLTYYENPAGSTTATKTTSNCETAFGCSPTASSTATATAVCELSNGGPAKRADCHPGYYLIYPYPETRVSAAEMRNLLKNQGVPDETTDANFYVSNSKYLGLNFVFAALTADQIAEIKGNFAVKAINRPAGIMSVTKRDANNRTSDELDEGIWVDPDTPEERSSSVELVRRYINVFLAKLLRRVPVATTTTFRQLLFVSQPPGVPIEFMDNKFTADDSQGAGQNIYSLDYGFSPINDLEGTLTKPIFTGPHIASTSDDGPWGHGSCILSLMVGKQLGLAKKANAFASVITRDGYINENFLDGLSKFYDHIIDNNKQGQAVVNMALSFTRGRGVSDEWVDRFGYILQQMVANNIFIVTGAGNIVGSRPTETAVDGYPALYRDPSHTPYIPQLVVAGGVDLDYGARWTGTKQADFINAWAPGDDVQCSDVFENGSGIKTGKGTSLASAQVAALAAYLMGKKPGTYTVATLTAEIQRLSWSRKSMAENQNGIFPNVIYNGELSAPVCKRADGPGCGLPGSGSNGVGSKPITIGVGASQPTCAAGNSCGTFCSSGPYCSAPCSGTCGNSNPDFLDPLNPSNPINSKPVTVSTATAKPITTDPATTKPETTSTAAPQPATNTYDIYQMV